MESGIWSSFFHIIFELGSFGILISMLAEGIGIPFPGDFVMGFYGFLAAQGKFQFVTVFLAASLGCWLGSWIAFFLGKRYGMKILFNFGRYAFIKDSYIVRAQKLSEKHGMLVLVLGRFLPGVRTVSSYIAGIGNMEWAEFFIYSLFGFFLWCFSWVGIGYWIGEHWQVIAQTIQSLLLFILLAIMILISGYFFWKRKNSKLF
ncbi:DedA family protein [Fodinisporobacter ferrooxydans]|uniref:DedA family protein n=1 Tax=Fodinisporobacter ferrooxydans TaxID=2901836 RepID=A0ABY4CNX0_9BACL|nr:DedA family protein [Alicyclobacillaceae bacterium MYW30-H2]